jgi:hypothetical protein
LRRRSGCTMLIRFVNQQMTEFQSKSIESQACLDLRIWCTRFGPCGSSWGGRFGMQIWLKYWWQMKRFVERHSPWWQQRW